METMRIQVRGRLAIGIFLAMFCTTVVGVAAAIHHWQATVYRVARANEETPVEAHRSGRRTQGRLPKAVIDNPVHVFGVIDPTVECKHTFEIHNMGEAPLKLAKGGTSCNCTTSDIPAEPIPPGMAAAITVASKLGEEAGEFSHTVLILTNDPANSKIELRIQGAVLARLATSPARVVAVDVRRNKPIAVDFTVYSQVWDDFVIGSANCSQADFQWEADSADAEVLKTFGAKSGYRVRLTLPPKNKGGGFSDWFEVSVLSSENADQPQSLRIPISGTVPSRIELTGKKLDGLGTLNLGPVALREPVREQLLLKVNDEHRRLTVREIRTKPDFLQVKLSPSRLGQDAGVYAIDVEIPATAPPCNWFTEKGEVVIVTDHPEASELKFNVAFAILSR
jgi:hypothetical protein